MCGFLIWIFLHTKTGLSLFLPCEIVLSYEIILSHIPTHSRSVAKYRMGYEKKNRSLLFSGFIKIPTLGSTVQWETRQASFPTGMVGPWVLTFLFPLNTNDGFYLSQIHLPDRRKHKKRTASR